MAVEEWSISGESDTVASFLDQLGLGSAGLAVRALPPLLFNGE
jgi:hypothetical protein